MKALDFTKIDKSILSIKVIPFEPKTDEEMKFYELDWVSQSYEEETLTI